MTHQWLPPRIVGSRQDPRNDGVHPQAREIPVVVSHVGGEAIARLEPLWLELHRHHQRVGGDTLGPYVSDAESWTARRSLYKRVLACPPSFALTAERDEALLGYCVVAVTPATQTWLPDTWGTGPRIAEIESLCVTAQARGAGLGSLMLDRVDAELAAAGIDDVIIGALNGNDDATRLYQRRGFRPAMTYMTRLADRNRPNRADPRGPHARMSAADRGDARWTTSTRRWTPSRRAACCSR